MIEVVKYSYFGPKKLLRGSITAIFGRRTREHGEKIEGRVVLEGGEAFQLREPEFYIISILASRKST